MMAKSAKTHKTLEGKKSKTKRNKNKRKTTNNTKQNMELGVKEWSKDSKTIERNNN